MKRILISAALALSLSGCILVVPEKPTTTVRPAQPIVTVTPIRPTRPAVSSIIRDFQPDRGQGGQYRVGDNVFFRATMARSGFATLVFYNDGTFLPDFEVRNIPVQVGLNLIPNTNTVVASEPTGVTRVRMFYSPQPNSNVSFLNGNGVSFLEDQTNAFLNFYAVDVRDVKDTFVVVTR